MASSMKNASGSSLSKGVFVFKGKKKVMNINDYIIESSDWMDVDKRVTMRRLQLYTETCNRVNAILRILESASSGNIFEELIEFTLSAHQHFTPSLDFLPDQATTGSGSIKKQLLPQQLAIPTAAFVTGVNVTDHAAMFANLAKMLVSRVTPHVVHLKSAHCSTLKATFANVISQLITNVLVSLLSIVMSYSDIQYLFRAVTTDEDDDDNNIGDERKKLRFLVCAMSTVAVWYSSLYKSSSEPRKQTSPSKLVTITTSPSSSPVTITADSLNLIPKTKVLKVVIEKETFVDCASGSAPELKSPQKFKPQSPIRSPDKTTPRADSHVGTPSKLRSARMPAVSASPLGKRCSPCKTSNDPENNVITASKQKCCDVVQQNVKPQTSENHKGVYFISPSKRRTCVPTTSRAVEQSERQLSKDEGKCVFLSPSKRARVSQDVYSTKTSTVANQSAEVIVMDGSSDSKLTNSYKPIVIILEDFEGFTPRVLQDFISICGHYVGQLPLVLVFGIATSLGVVHQSLPYHVSSLLAMQPFHAPLSSDYLSLVIDNVLMNVECPFKLGGRVFNFLLDTFLYHDFSAVNFILALKFCILEHYKENWSSIVCQPYSDINSALSELSHCQLDHIRSNPSFKKYVESQPEEEQIALLEDDVLTRPFVSDKLKKFHRYHIMFYPVLRVLHAFTCNLPQYPLGKQLRELYATCLLSNICTTADYARAIVLLKSLSRDELSKCLLSAIKHLSYIPIPNCRTAVDIDSKLQCEMDKRQQEVAGYLLRLNNMSTDCLAEAVDECKTEPVAESVTLPKKLDMYTLKQTLQGLDAKKRKMSVYEQLRLEIVEFLDNQLFREYLLSPTCMTLHEVFYYDNVDELKQHISAAPRSTIQRALTNPYLYLKNGSLKHSDVDSGHISSDLPDLCIVYKLHLECGRLINLYDWLQAFVMIVESSEGASHAREPSNKQIDRTVHARFIRAVSELHILGFIKSTSRKTDHVARLTWGC